MVLDDDLAVIEKFIAAADEDDVNEADRLIPPIGNDAVRLSLLSRDDDDFVDLDLGAAVTGAVLRAVSGTRFFAGAATETLGVVPLRLLTVAVVGRDGVDRPVDDGGEEDGIGSGINDDAGTVPRRWMIGRDEGDDNGIAPRLAPDDDCTTE